MIPIISIMMKWQFKLQSHVFVYLSQHFFSSFYSKIVHIFLKDHSQFSYQLSISNVGIKKTEAIYAK